MKKMRHMKRKALVALVLSVTMLLTLMPGLVFGVSDDQGDPDTVSSSIDYPTVNFTDVAPSCPRSAALPPGAPRPVTPVMPIPAAITAITAWWSTRPPFITRRPAPMTLRWRPTPPAARSSAPSPATSPRTSFWSWISPALWGITSPPQRRTPGSPTASVPTTQTIITAWTAVTTRRTATFTTSCPTAVMQRSLWTAPKPEPSKSTRSIAETTTAVITAVIPSIQK